MRKSITIITLFFCIFLLPYCNRKNIKIEKNIFNSDYYLQKNYNSKIRFLDSLSTLTIKFTNDLNSIEFLFNLAAEYYYLNDYQKTLYISRRIYGMSKKSYDTLNLAKAYYYIGDAYEQNHRDSAYYYYKKQKNYIKY